MADRPALFRRALAECIGTFALVFACCGAIITTAERHGALGVVGVGLVFFLVLLAAIATLDHVSGAHFNPGVSLSFFLTRHLPARDLGAYWTAQFAGATLAALLLLVIWPGHPADLGATIPSIPVLSEAEIRHGGVVHRRHRAAGYERRSNSGAVSGSEALNGLQ